MSGVVIAAVKFKYDAQLAAIGNCPPSNAKGKTMTAYRFIYDPDPANHSYLPQALKKPERKWANAEDECCGMGISMFTTEASARRLYRNMSKRYDVAKALGTHLAELAITPAHGDCDRPKNGHFNLHEFAGCDLSKVASGFQAM